MAVCATPCACHLTYRVCETASFYIASRYAATFPLCQKLLAKLHFQFAHKAAAAPPPPPLPSVSPCASPVAAIELALCHINPLKRSHHACLALRDLCPLPLSISLHSESFITLTTHTVPPLPPPPTLRTLSSLFCIAQHKLFG